MTPLHWAIRLKISNVLIYRISSYSFSKNYSFLNLEILRSQYIRPKVIVHTGAEPIQGRKLFKGGNYMRKYGMSLPSAWVIESAYGPWLLGFLGLKKYAWTRSTALKTLLTKTHNWRNLLSKHDYRNSFLENYSFLTVENMKIFI